VTQAFPPEIRIPRKILCRKDALLQLPSEAASIGSRGVIVHGASLEKSGIKERTASAMKKSGVECLWICRPSGEPDLNGIASVIREGKAFRANWIAGIGGGSALDLAKAAAGLFNARESPAYYQEGGRLEEKGIPFIAVPTTAGSGSEATLNSVIINPVKKMKLSIRHPAFLASLVILDPVLLKSLPREVIVHSGMDAFVQAYESYISKNASLFTETLALRAIEMIASRLPGAARTKNEDALHEMLFASFLTGIAFSHSRLGVIHGIAHPLGVLYDIPHGLVCSACLIPSIKLNRSVVGEKYGRISRAVGGDFLEKVAALQKELGIVSPFKGKPLIEKEKIIEETLKSGSTAANPGTITREDADFLLREIF